MMNQMESGNPMVGGASMLRSRDIVDNAVNSADHTTLVAAVKAAGLVQTLKSKGPFTVFAPTNQGFDKLPAGTVDMLVKPENKAMLTKILTYHVLAGKFDSHAIAKRIKAGGGKAQLKTVSGGTLWACTPCVKSRGYTQDDLIAGTVITGASPMHELIKGGAATLSF